MGTSWRMMELGGGDFIEANVQQVGMDSVIDVWDSVKTIVLTAKDSLGNTLSHPVNGFNFSFSKTFGFSEAFNFHTFPDTLEVYSLKGAHNPDAGYLLPTRLEVYEFEVGDEFHYMGGTSNYDGNSAGSSSDKLWKRIILNKTVQPNFIMYEDSIVEYRIYSTFGYNSFSDTTFTTYTRNFVVNLTPEFAPPLATDSIYVNSSPFPLVQMGSYKSQSGYGGGVKRTFYHPWSEPFTLLSDTCVRVFPGNYDVHEALVEQMAGLGDVKWDYYFQDGFSLAYQENEGELLYFKKANSSWGVPLDFSAMTYRDEPDQSVLEMQVFPQPAQEHLTIRQKGQIWGPGTLLILRDTYGRLIWEQEVQGKKETEIYRNHLPAGLYILQLIAPDQLMVSRRIIWQ